MRSCPDACGTQTCGAGCIWTICDFNKDGYEPNETWAQATYLGQIDEGEPMPPVTDAWLHQAESPIATPGEIDRYYFHCYESDSIFDWSMTISASLSGVGGWHSLCIFYDRSCDGSVDVQHCSTGEGALNASTGDVDGASQASDDGCIDVEVYGDWSCTAYTLELICD
jgi:hypothetical protein